MISLWLGLLLAESRSSVAWSVANRLRAVVHCELSVCAGGCVVVVVTGFCVVVVVGGCVVVVVVG